MSPIIHAQRGVLAVGTLGVVGVLLFRPAICIWAPRHEEEVPGVECGDEAYSRGFRSYRRSCDTRGSRRCGSCHRARDARSWQTEGLTSEGRRRSTCASRMWVSGPIFYDYKNTVGRTSSNLASSPNLVLDSPLGL